MQATQDTYGFISNLAAIQSESPAMLEGYTTLAGIFDKTNLSETERQIILMTNNRLNGCDYCMAAHTAISKMAKVPNDVIEALRVFAARVNETRGWVDESDLDAFFAAGYTKQTALEVIVGTSLKVMSNYTNHVAETPIDTAFRANAWSADNAA